MAETVAWSKCHSCGGSVAVKKNRSDRAYYRCDHCGIKVEHTWTRSSDKYLTDIGGKTPESAAPQPAPAPEKKPAKRSDSPPAPAPAASRSTFF